MLVNLSDYDLHPNSRLFRSKSTRSIAWRLKVSLAHTKLHQKDKGICRTCKRAITEEEAMPWVLKKGQWACKECERKRCRAKQLRYRLELLKEYGGKCVCCNETAPEFLTVDHIKNNGRAQKRSYKETYGKEMNFYNWLRRHGYPKDDYRMMCWNCNCARAKYGYCPHERVSVDNENMPHPTAESVSTRRSADAPVGDLVPCVLVTETRS